MENLPSTPLPLTSGSSGSSATVVLSGEEALAILSELQGKSGAVDRLLQIHPTLGDALMCRRPAPIHDHAEIAEQRENSDSDYEESNTSEEYDRDSQKRERREAGNSLIKKKKKHLRDGQGESGDDRHGKNSAKGCRRGGRRISPVLPNHQAGDSDLEDRGSGDNTEPWETSKTPASETLIAQGSATEFLARLCLSASCNIHNPECNNWIASLKTSFHQHCLELPTHDEVAGADLDFADLTLLALRCKDLNERSLAVRFIGMLNMIGLSFCADSTKRRNKRLTYKKQHLKCGLSTHQVSYNRYIEWISGGARYAQLAAGGSVYLLLVVLVTESKWILDHSLEERALGQLVDWLRQPPTAPASLQGMIRERLIPLLTLLSQDMPLRLDSRFNPHILIQSGRDRSGASCSNLGETDGLFESLKRFSFVPIPRDHISWSSFGTPMMNSLQPTSLDDLNHPGLHNALSQRSAGSSLAPPLTVLDSGNESEDVQDFRLPCGPHCSSHSVLVNLAADKNKRNPWSDAKSQAAFDKTERREASQAVRTNTLEEFFSQLNSSFDMQGVRKTGRPYFYLPNKWIHKQHLLLNAPGSAESTTNLLAYIDGSMPENLSLHLMDTLEAAFSVSRNGSEILKSIDTSANGETPPSFGCLHFSYYTRCGTRGEEAPNDIHPRFLRKSNVQSTNHDQFVVRVSSDLEKHPREYGNLCSTFKEVFTWMMESLEKHAPHISKDLALFADILPGRVIPASYPWTSFVVNVNVCTRGHVDGKDTEAGCAIICISKAVGGELCFYEGGMIIELKNGNLIVFPSSKLSHFNLHYKGKRATLVCHSDKSGVGYQDDFNGWNKNKYFH